MQNDSLIDFTCQLYHSETLSSDIQIMRTLLSKLFLNEISFEAVSEFSYSISNDQNPMKQLLLILREGIDNEPLPPPIAEQKSKKKR